MANFNIKQLTPEMKKDLVEFSKSREDAIYLLAKNPNKSTKEIVARIQTSNLDRITASTLKTEDEWLDWMSSLSSLSGVQKSFGPLTVDKKFSSFVLMENSENFEKLRYPFMHSFASEVVKFEGKAFPNYELLKQQIEKLYNVKIVEESSKDQPFNYKQKLFGKNIITVNSNVSYGQGKTYEISEQERITRILDVISQSTVKSFEGFDDKSVSRGKRFIATLFSDILLSRALNYGDEKSGRDIESALTLQLSNVISKLNLSASELHSLAKVGLKSAVKIIDNLGISKSDIVKSLKNSGYVYVKEPETIEDALFPLCKEQVLQINTEPQKQEKKEQPKVENHIVENKNTPKEVDNDLPQFEKPVEQPKESISSSAFPFELTVMDYDKEMLVSSGVSSFKNSESNKKLKATTKKALVEEKQKPEEILQIAQLYPVEKEKSVDYLTAKSGQKYIDKCVMKLLTNLLKSAQKSVLKSEKLTKSTSTNLRKCDFLEHMIQFYDVNRNKDLSLMKEVVGKERKIDLDHLDNSYAHHFALSMLLLRDEVVEKVFVNQEKIMKNGKTDKQLVEEYFEAVYGAKIKDYFKEVLKTKLKPIFQSIDEQQNMGMEL